MFPVADVVGLRAVHQQRIRCTHRNKAPGTHDYDGRCVALIDYGGALHSAPNRR